MILAYLLVVAVVHILGRFHSPQLVLEFVLGARGSSSFQQILRACFNDLRRGRKTEETEGQCRSWGDGDLKDDTAMAFKCDNYSLLERLWRKGDGQCHGKVSLKVWLTFFKAFLGNSGRRPSLACVFRRLLSKSVSPSPVILLITHVLYRYDYCTVQRTTLYYLVHAYSYKRVLFGRQSSSGSQDPFGRNHDDMRTPILLLHHDGAVIDRVSSYTGEIEAKLSNHDINTTKVALSFVSQASAD